MSSSRAAQALWTLCRSRNCVSAPRHKTASALVVRRYLVAPPDSSSGPLMERRADRELPDIKSSSRRWLKTMPIFLAILGASTLAIFNYQKSSSSVVNSTLYALRTSQQARDILGDEIYFRDRFPWVWGTLNQLHGHIDIGFGVKGDKSSAYMRFKSIRKTRTGYFETKQWTLEMNDGRVVNLLDKDDPFLNSPVKTDKTN